MMNIEEYKRNKKNKNVKKGNSLFKRYLIKIMICLVFFLIFLIGIKKINNFDQFIYNNFYMNNLSFAKFNSWYTEHFGNILPINNDNDIQVFNESLDYIEKNDYLDGVKLIVKDNYLVPVLSDGIVIYIGEKDNYGKTIIIQNELGIEYWYSNIEFGNITLYDYVKKGDYLGETINNELILVFKKDGKRKDYEEYI